MEDTRDMPTWLEDEFKRLIPKVVWGMDTNAAEELSELAGIAHFRVKTWSSSATYSAWELGENTLGFMPKDA